jgi:hypothetical protein
MAPIASKDKVRPTTVVLVFIIHLFLRFEFWNRGTNLRTHTHSIQAGTGRLGAAVANADPGRSFQRQEIQSPIWSARKETRIP